MKVSRPGSLIVLALIAAVVVGIGAVALAAAQVPDTSVQLAGLTPAISIQISSPGNHDQWTVGQPAGILVDASYLEPLAEVRLFVDGSQLSPPAAPAVFGPNSATISWFWIPEQPGLVHLTAQAVDKDGVTVLSNPVAVEVIAPPAPAVLEEIPLAALPDAAQVPAPAALEAELLPIPNLPANVTIDNVDEYLESLPEDDAASHGLESSAERMVNVASLQETPLATEILGDLPTRQSSTWQRYAVYAQSMVQAKNAVAPPAPPQVRGSAQGCEIELRILDRATDELGLRLYHLGPADSMFQQIAEFGAFDGSEFLYYDPDRSLGKHLYYAASYNLGGETAGNLNAFDVTDETCSQNNPLAIGLTSASLSTDLPIEAAYCFVTINDEDWGRIPGNADEFIHPENGSFDLSPYLKDLLSPPQYPLKLTLECWGWQGDELVYLGTGTQVLYDGPAKVQGDHFSLSGSVNPIMQSYGHLPLHITSIAPPTNLHFPTDLQECFSHAEEIPTWHTMCYEAIDRSNAAPLVFLYDWDEAGDCQAGQACAYNTPYSDLYGYNLYQVIDGQDPVLRRTAQRYGHVTFSFLSWSELDPVNGGEYFVRAVTYDGLESADSNHIFYHPITTKTILHGGSYTTTMVLVHKHILPSPEKVIGPIFIDYDFSQPPCSTDDCSVETGYIAESRHLIDGGYKYVNIYIENFIAFDPSQLSGTVTSAVLRWTAGIWTSGNGKHLFDDRCLNYIEDSFFGTVQSSPIMLQANQDVTYQLRHYRAGAFSQHNDDTVPFGFFFKTGMHNYQDTETLGGYDICVVSLELKDIWLEVETFQ